MLECFTPLILLCSRNVASARLSLLALLRRMLEGLATLIPLRSRNVMSARFIASLLGIMEGIVPLIPLTRLHKCLLQRALVDRLSWVTNGWDAAGPLRRGFESTGSDSVTFGCTLTGHVTPSLVRRQSIQVCSLSGWSGNVWSMTSVPVMVF